MPTTVGQVYLDICNVLWEPGGLVAGLITPADVLSMAGEVITDFVTKTGTTKKLININIEAGIDTYQLPDNVFEAQAAAYDQIYLHHTSTFYLDNTSSIWSQASAVPTTWKQDEIAPTQVQVTPTPNQNGNPVGTNLGQGFYGVLSLMTNQTDFSIIGQARGFYGVLRGFSGNPYIEVLNPTYGVWSYMCASDTNLQVIATSIPPSLAVQLNTYLADIPDSFVPAIKYGILARIFAQDGEQKDMQKSYYCMARYTEVVNLAASIMSEEFEEMADAG